MWYDICALFMISVHTSNFTLHYIIEMHCDDVPWNSSWHHGLLSYSSWHIEEYKAYKHINMTFRTICDDGYLSTEANITRMCVDRGDSDPDWDGAAIRCRELKLCF